MRTVEVIADFRRLIDDRLEPYIWSTDEAVIYLDRAQDDFVRAIGGFADTDRCFVYAGQETIELPERVMKIRRIEDITNRRDVPLVNVLTEDATPDPYRSSYSGASPKLVLGEREGFMVFDTPPSQPFEIKIYYYRLAKKPVTSTAIDLEVKPYYHYALIQNMLYQAYSKQDSDGYDSRAAARALELYAIEVERAKEEKGRLEHVPRTVKYGGL